MKRQVLFTAALLAAIILTGCSQKENGAQDNPGTVTEKDVANHGNSSENSEKNDQGGTAGGKGEEGSSYRTGIGIVSRLEKAQNAGTVDGSAEVSTVAAAVTVDEDDRIVKCTIDMVEQVIPISNTGSIGSPANTEYPTKKELGDSYGMKEASPIGKEWYEQIESFEQYVIGKTAEEINGISTDSHGYIKDNDLNSSVSISISDFQAALTKAVENAY